MFVFSPQTERTTSYIVLSSLFVCCVCQLDSHIRVNWEDEPQLRKLACLAWRQAYRALSQLTIDMEGSSPLGNTTLGPVVLDDIKSRLSKP